MVHEWIGQTGHFFVIVAFVASLWATWNYYWAANKNTPDPASWLKLGRIGFGIHSFALFGVVASLFYIIYNHYFEYHYAWSHSSRSLPVHYMISCFWEGQEGSFLVWMFWQALLGLILMKFAGKWEAPVLAVVAFVQAFLVSMILGSVIPGLELKIGSSPFILLRDVMDAPIFALNPDYVPEDGTGLNPLLQNYWMVIHPPTLFLGFALTLVPFAYCIAGLWKKQHGEWIRPALSWTSAAALVLGVGILMGAYWAYETLNFGGYWNWDPVENAVYIPWLVLVAGLHLMIVYRKNGTALKPAVLFILVMFLLILYSTFLTRSGILGNSSVHSFTDLGLSGQLLLYMMAFVVMAGLLVVREWKNMPATAEVSPYSREFWIFIGATVLSLMAFQVLVPTSIPVYNALAKNLFNYDLNMAPPANPEEFYTNFQLWFAVGLALLSGTAQFFWWQKMDMSKLKNALVLPVVVSLLLASAVLIVADVQEPKYMVLLVAAIYAVVSNLFVLLGLKHTNVKLAGGSVAHIGIAMILLGILFSSGYSKVISQNTTGLLYSREFDDQVNQENVLLWLNEPQKMQQYELVYKGQFMEADDVPGYVHKQLLRPTDKPNVFVGRADYYFKGKKYFGEGDTVQVQPENTYYRVEYTNEAGRKFTLFPRAQVNPQMGFIASPDIFRGLSSDLYTHVTVVPDSKEAKWSKPEAQKIKIGDKFFVNDYVAILEGLQQVREVEGVPLQENDVAVKAKVRIMAEEGKEFNVEPVYILKISEKTSGSLPAVIDDLAVKLSFTAIHPDEDSITITQSKTQKDYIILKAMEKPLINLLWTGTLLLVAGFCIAIYRRYTEYRMLQQKGQD